MFTVGHGTASRAELLDRLAQGPVEQVVDVRTAPGSRRSPHLAREALERWLPEAGIGYRWEPRLGGFRKPAGDSPDVALRNASFRGYAGQLRTEEARQALLGVVGRPALAVLCSETVWWRCHRRLVADAAVLLHGEAVEHLLPGRRAAHRLTQGVRRTGGLLVYDDVEDAATAAGGDAACWLDRVCERCGRIAEHAGGCSCDTAGQDR